MENVMMDENTKCQEVDKVTMELSEFKQLRIWLCWRYEKKNNRDRSTKVPYGADGIAIGTTQDYSGRWSTFEEASRAYEKLGFDGVGFVIPKGFGGIDSDHRKEDDPINADLMEHFQTYAENSPSKTGRHWIFKCDTSAIPSQNGKLDSCYYCKNPNNDLEIYFGGMTNRFLTFTGDIISNLPIVDCTDAAQWFLDKYMFRPALPDALDIVPCAYLTIEQGIAKALASKNGDKFRKVWNGDTSDYNSPSEADMYLAGRLAFWFGCDYNLMEEAFSKSNLGQREKWEREDYRKRTLTKAIQGCREIYTPDYGKPSAAEDFSEEEAHKIAHSLIKPAVNVKSRAVPWLIEGFLIEGSTTGIQGLPGSGKSFLTCKTAVEIANGGEFPKADGTMMKLSPGRVLMANFDDALEFGIKPRLESLGLTAEGAKRIFFLDPETATGITFDDKRLATVFEECRPSLAIFDTLQHFIGGKVDLHRANETNTAMAQLKLLAEKYNTAVIIVQHISKNAASGNGGASVLWGLGSTAINGLFRSVWTVGKVKGEDETLRAAVSSKNNLLPYVPAALQYSLSQTEGFQWRGISREITARDLIRGDSDTGSRGRPSEQRSEAQEFILNALTFGKMKAVDVFEEAKSEGISERTLKRAKSQLGIKTFQEGRVWYWELPKEHQSVNIH